MGNNYKSTEEFVKLFKKAQKKYKNSKFRLAAEGWDKRWKTLVATILSAQSRDEITIPISTRLFRKYPTLESLSNANYEEVLKTLSSLNYNKSKAKHIILTAKILLEKHDKEVPNSLEELLELPGVGRKTANLILGKEFNIPKICVDTHVHRICNVFGFVNTKDDREKTEKELEEFVPKKYWKEINRIFVLWGKSTNGHSREDFERSLIK